MGEATTIDAHLMDMKELDMQRMTELGKKRDALILYSDSANRIIEAAK
jgi:hypothetical protein